MTESGAWRAALLLTAAAGMLLGSPRSASGGALRRERPPKTLHVLSIGIDRLAAFPQVTTRYSASDARRIAELMRQRAAVRDPRKDGTVRTTLLVEEAATIAAITSAFEQLVHDAGPDDMVVIYFAGQAITTRAGDDQILVPFDFTKEDGDHAFRGEKSERLIGSARIGAWLSRIQARRQVFIIEAASSDGAIDTLIRAATRDELQLGSASRRSRLVIGTVGEAIETDALGSGTVTASLHLAFAGAADVGPKKNGRVSSYELEACLPRIHFGIARGARYESGRIRVRAIGGDFAVARLDPRKAGAATGAAEEDGASRGRLRGRPSAEAAPDPRGRKDRALIFATDQYQHWQRLQNPIRDARALKGELETRYGFDVELKENPSYADMREAIAAYQQMEYGPDDQLLLFVAGHGQYDEIYRTGHVIARDSGPGPDPTRAISNSDLRTAVDGIPCRHILVMLDTCFGGTFDEQVSKGGHRGGDMYADVAIAKIAKRILGYHARLYLTSGGKEYVPDGRPGHHSPFAFKVLEALRGGAGRKGLVTWKHLAAHLLSLPTEPRAGMFGLSEPGADFLFILQP